MKTITYIYRTFDLGCDCCCSDSESYLEIRDDDGFEEVACYEYICNEQELREYLKENHPELGEYLVDNDNSWWF